MLRIVLAVVSTIGVGCGRVDPVGVDFGAVTAPPPVIAPELIHYEQTASFPVDMQQVHALAVGPDDRIYVGGDRSCRVFSNVDHAVQLDIALQAEPTCLTVGGSEHSLPGHIYVGLKDHIEVFAADGTPVASWDSLGEKALITSIAIDEQDIFVADAGNRIVLRYDVSGNPIGRIGERDDIRKIPGFVITSEYFDLAVSPADGLLRVVNPRMLRIETYTFDGDLEQHWGEATPGVEGFFGCCNPIHFAMLPDGRFATAEKGAERVKVYGSDGRFESVVAGPDQLDTQAADLAVDSDGRILVLDPKARSVRIFEPKKDVAAQP